MLNVRRRKLKNEIFISMKTFIRKLLRESLDEIYFMGHSNDRIKERFKVFSDEDMPKHIKDAVNRNLDILDSHDLSTNKSYGVMIGSFHPNKNSEYYVETKDGRGYYSIIDDGVIHDSTGDQIWVVVRANNATTVMLRKAIQTADVEHNKEKLRVDVVIKDINKFIESKTKQQQPNQNKFKKLTLKNGVKVKYFNVLNKFETMDGNTIEIDDIFDELPEDVQNIVLNQMG